MSEGKDLYVFAIWNWEEPSKRALALVSAWPTRQRAEEEVCFSIIEDAEEWMKENNEAGEDEHQIDFYAALDETIENLAEQASYYVEEVKIEPHQVS